MGDRRVLIMLAAIAALPIFYVGGGWVSDDFVHFTQPPAESVLDVFQLPDPFGFYRPIPQLSFRIERGLFGATPAAYRATNVLLHVTVVLLAYLAAIRLLTPRGAAFAALAFVLTPKAPTVAVLWISARPEMLMSVFALLATLAWLRWQQDRGWWLAVSAACYLLAFLSKESAALLPLALAAMQARQASVSSRERILTAAAIALLAAVPMAMRTYADALMPISAHEHYHLDFSVARIFRSFQVYTARALPSPLGLIVGAGISAACFGRLLEALRHVWPRDFARVTVAALVWFVAILAPVTPVVARHELYLYLPVFGFCLLAGALADGLLAIQPRRATQLVVGVYAIGFLTYQQMRHLEAHEVQQFTRSLVGAIGSDTRLSTDHGTIAFVAADDRSEQLMRKGIGGYINGATVIALPQRTFAASVTYRDTPGTVADQRLIYRFIHDRVQLER